MAQILLADDISSVREALAMVLRLGGHEVVEVASGSDARAQVQNPNIDLFLLDIWMPGQSGLDVLKYLRERGDVRPVILMSGGGPGATLEQATAIGDLYGAHQMLFKPFEDDDLLKAVSSALGL